MKMNIQFEFENNTGPLFVNILKVVMPKQEDLWKNNKYNRTKENTNIYRGKPLWGRKPNKTSSMHTLTKYYVRPKE